MRLLLPMLKPLTRARLWGYRTERLRVHGWGLWREQELRKERFWPRESFLVTSTAGPSFAVEESRITLLSPCCLQRVVLSDPGALALSEDKYFCWNCHLPTNYSSAVAGHRSTEMFSVDVFLSWAEAFTAVGPLEAWLEAQACWDELESIYDRFYNVKLGG